MQVMRLTKELAEAVTNSTPLEVTSVLKALADRLGGAECVRDVRFRPVDWNGQAVVHVPQWVALPTGKDPHPRLLRRVFLDPEDVGRMDCFVGLVARVARIRELRERIRDEEVSEQLLAEVTSPVPPREIEHPSYRFDKKNSNKTKRRIFAKFSDRFRNIGAEYLRERDIWKAFHKELRSASIEEDSLSKVEARIPNPPWNRDALRKKQWVQLVAAGRENDWGLETLVEKTACYYEDLSTQWTLYEDVALAPACEIAVPVRVAGRLRGILNIHGTTEGKGFTKKQEGLCLQYADILAAVCLRDQGKLLWDLENVVKSMTAETRLERIASEIAKGIRNSLVGLEKGEVFPLLYVCRRPMNPDSRLESEFEYSWNDTYQQRPEPQKAESRDHDHWLRDLELWHTENQLGKIHVRKDGLGASALEKWQKCARGTTPRHRVTASKYFVVSGDVDNPDSVTASKTAWLREIKTTGCLPLVFRKRVHGLLYLHCKQRHFFTQSELEALDAFGAQAAIAVNNAKSFGPPYRQLYGDALINALGGGQE